LVCKIGKYIKTYLGVCLIRIFAAGMRAAEESVTESSLLDSKDDRLTTLCGHSLLRVYALGGMGTSNGGW